jgi:hypothetical protein
LLLLSVFRVLFISSSCNGENIMLPHSSLSSVFSIFMLWSLYYLVIHYYLIASGTGGGSGGEEGTTGGHTEQLLNSY